MKAQKGVRSILQYLKTRGSQTILTSARIHHVNAVRAKRAEHDLKEPDIA